MEREDSASERVLRAIFLRSLFGDSAVLTAVERIGSMMRTVTCRAGMTIYRQGEASDYLYFIVDGHVALDAPGEPRWTFGPRDGLGFQDAMQDQPHARTALALTDVTALAFSVDDWMDVLDDHSELSRGAIMNHARSVRAKFAELAPDGGFAPVEAALVQPDLGDEVGLVERMVMFSEAPCFERSGIQAVASLARVAQVRRLKRGETLLAVGERPQGIYLVGAGMLSAERKEPELRAQFAPGSLAVGLSFLGVESSDITLFAEWDALVLSVAEDDFFDIADDHFDLMRAVFSYMARERGLAMREIAVRAERATARTHQVAASASA